MIAAGCNDWNQGVLQACRHGRVDLNDFFIAYGAGKDIAVDGAMLYGQANFFHARWRERMRECRAIVTFTRRAFSYACYGGSKNIIDFVIKHHDRPVSKDVINEGLAWAAGRSHLDVVRRCISMGADDWRAALIKACQHGQRVMISAILDGADGIPKYDATPKDLRVCIIRAAHRAHIDTVQHLVSKLTRRNVNCLPDLEGDDVRFFFGHVGIVHILLGAGYTPTNYDVSIQAANMAGYRELAHLLVDYRAGPTTWAVTARSMLELDATNRKHSRRAQS